MKNSFKLCLLALCLFLLFFQISCNNNDEDANTDCSNIACTEVYITLVVTIEDQNQNPVALEYFEVINLANGSDVTISLSPSQLASAQATGQYPLVADGGIEKNQELQLQFKGFVNSQEVISSNYTAGADCCHVSLISGDVQLTL